MNRKTLAKVAAGIAAVVLGLGLVLAGVLARDPSLRAFPWMPSAYDAKEACSCAFVSGRSDEACAAFVHQDVVPIQSRVIDRDARSVTTTSLLLSSTARWVGQREGCRLDP